MILGLIPARSGSKRIPNKNIWELDGHPLFAWSIAASKMCPQIAQTVVSTDSDEYAQIALKYGAEVIMRPPEICGDDASDLSYIKHALDTVDELDLIVLLRPTTPLRDPKELTRAIDIIKKGYGDYTGLRSLVKMNDPIEKTFRVIADLAVPVSLSQVDKPSQQLLESYAANGYVDIIKAETIRHGYLFGQRIAAFIVKDIGEIDSPDDLWKVKGLLKGWGSPLYEYLRNIK